MDTNIIAVLVGVVVGWILSQLTEIVKEKKNREKKVESLYVELSDINAWLSRMKKEAKYSLQLLVLNEDVYSRPGSIYTFVFEEHFHEICSSLTRGARVGFTDCYDSIKTINELISDLKPLIDSENDEKRRKLCSKFEAIYSMAFQTHAKTGYLLQNPSGNLDNLRGMAVKLDENLEDELKNLAAEAKELGIGGIKSSYYSDR